MPERLHAWLIVNGKHAGDDALRAAVHAMRAKGLRIDVRVTWEAGDAARFVDEALSAHADSVIAAGGDGTLGAVAAALAERDAPADALPALAVLPMGTANDFATSAGITDDLEAALGLLHQPPVAVDLLRVDADDARHWCINLASGGYGATVTTETPEDLKQALGGLAYVISGLARLGNIEPIPAYFEARDFAWSGAFIALGIGNARQAGGGQILCPDAMIDDGLLDLTIVPRLEGALMGALGTLIADGRQAVLDQVSVRLQRAAINLSADQPLVLNLDGEPVQARSFRIACVPGRLRMHLPAGCPLLQNASRPG